MVRIEAFQAFDPGSNPGGCISFTKDVAQRSTFRSAQARNRHFSVIIINAQSKKSVMNKKGVELAFNTIIISIIALVVLAFALWLIGKSVGIVDRPLPEMPNTATADQPIIVLDATIKPGKQHETRIDFFNNQGTTIEETTLPTITCTAGLIPHIEAIGHEVPVGETTSYRVLISVPEGTESKGYPCRITIDETDTEFILKVR